LVLPDKHKLKSAQGERRISLEQLTANEKVKILELTIAATPQNKSLIEVYEKA